MFINKIVLENFRIYKGLNEISFQPDDHRNVHIISGYNGYGKTTLLTSLVWCLYGGQMQDVDDNFKRRIREAGGYPNFLEGCLNRVASLELDKSYSVSIFISNFKVPGIIANEVEIRRSFSIGDKSDNLDIYLDGQKNELVQNVGNDIFVQDFVLPKEIAKFFFFDAEKITALAENQSIDEKKQLGKAYSEVLGIKKYVDLRNNLIDIRLKYKKESATAIDIKQFTELEEKVVFLEQELSNLENKKRILKLRINELEEQTVIFQTKLWRVGSTLNIDELNKLRDRKHKLQGVSDELKASFKQLLDYAPFAMAGKLFFTTVNTARLEFNLKNTNISREQITSTINKLAEALNNFPETVDKGTISNTILPLLEQLSNFANVNSSSTMQLNLSSESFAEIQAIEKQLKFSYKEEFKRLSKELKRNRYELNEVSRKLSQAESKEGDNTVKHLQMKLDSVYTTKHGLIQEVENIIILYSVTQNDLNIRRKILSEFEKKLDVKADLKVKDEIAIRLINELDQFIVAIQKEKQHLLEESICQGLNKLMHKKHFVKLVSIQIEGEVIAIDLIGESGDKINKEDLSMGEKQLYATAIFQALVKESKIEFPVFIDSPMQKLDISHARNILTDFYPNVSKQVVILPLLNKEISELEYKIIENHVKSCHLIVHNKDEESSSIQKIKNNELFDYQHTSDFNV